MTNSIISLADQEEISKKIFYDRVKILHDHLLTTSIPAVLLCASVVFFALHSSGNKPLLLGWYLMAISLCVLRFGLVKWYQHDSNNLRLHLNLFILITTLSGLIWGAAGTILTPQHNILDKVLIIIMIAGLNAGGCQTLKASRTANSLFMLTSILPLVFWLLFQKEIIYTYLSLAMVGYLCFMLVLAHKTYIQFINSLQLQYENEILLKQLLIKHSQLKKINEELGEEINEHEKAKSRLKYLASHDFLTGIENRFSFDTQFERTLVRSKVHKSEFCVIYIDVDYFKTINDNYGHDIGDLVLIEVAKKLKANLRQQDTLVRIGGDEFVILMADKDVKQITRQFSQRVYKTFLQYFIINGYSIPVSLSMGSSFFPDDGDNKKILLKKADLALYRAKMSGRSRFEFYKDESKMLE